MTSLIRISYQDYYGFLWVSPRASLKFHLTFSIQTRKNKAKQNEKQKDTKQRSKGAKEQRSNGAGSRAAKIHAGRKEKVE